MSLAPGDTDPTALAVMTELYARMTPAEKLARVRALRLRERVQVGDEPPVALFFDTAEHSALRKLEYRRGGEASDRQWRDVVAILRVQGDALDRARMQEWGSRLGVADLLDRAFDEAHGQAG